MDPICQKSIILINIGEHTFRDWEVDNLKDLTLHHRLCDHCLIDISLILLKDNKSFYLSFDIKNDFVKMIEVAIDKEYTLNLPSYKEAMKHIDSTLEKLSKLELFL